MNLVDSELFKVKGGKVRSLSTVRDTRYTEMDKSKTVEFLRGMKFMQRKEEAKRREIFEVKRRDNLKAQTVSGGAAAESKPTVIHYNSFRSAQYTLSRKSFLREAPKAEPASAPSATDPQLEEWMEESDGEGDEDPTGVGKKTENEDGEGRFFLSESSRAPKMPKRLEKEMRQRKRQRTDPHE